MVWGFKLDTKIESLKSVEREYNGMTHRNNTSKLIKSQSIDIQTLELIVQVLDDCIAYMDNIILYQQTNSNSIKIDREIIYYASLLYMVKIGETLSKIKNKYNYNIEKCGLLFEKDNNNQKIKLQNGALIQVRNMIIHGMFYDQVTQELFISFFESGELEVIKQYIADIASHEFKWGEPTNKQISYGINFNSLMLKAKDNVRYEEERKKQPGNIQKSINNFSENDQNQLETLRYNLKQTSDKIIYQELNNIIYTLNLLIKWGALEKKDPDHNDSFEYTINNAILDQEVVIAATTQILLDASTQLVNLMSLHLSIVSGVFTQKKIETEYKLEVSEKMQNHILSAFSQNRYTYKQFAKVVRIIRKKRNILVHDLPGPDESRETLHEMLNQLLRIIPIVYCIKENIEQDPPNMIQDNNIHKKHVIGCDSTSLSKS